MPTPPRAKAAIYIKETAGYPGGENSKELQLNHCEEFCQYHDLEIIARYHDPAGVRTDFEWMMGEATQEDPPFEYIVVYKLRNFSQPRLEPVFFSVLRTVSVLMPWTNLTCHGVTAGVD